MIRSKFAQTKPVILYFFHYKPQQKVLELNPSIQVKKPALVSLIMIRHVNNNHMDKNLPAFIKTFQFYSKNKLCDFFRL